MTSTSLRLCLILLLSFFALTEQLFPILKDADAGHLAEEPSRTGGFVEAVSVEQQKNNHLVFGAPFLPLPLLHRVRRASSSSSWRRSARYNRSSRRGCCQGVWWPGTSYGWGYNSKCCRAARGRR